MQKDPDSIQKNMLIIMSSNIRIYMKGMSTEKLADESGVSRRMIEYILSRNANPTISTISKLEAYFGSSILKPINEQ